MIVEIHKRISVDQPIDKLVKVLSEPVKIYPYFISVLTIEVSKDRIIFFVTDDYEFRFCGDAWWLIGEGEDVELAKKKLGIPVLPKELM